MKNRFLVGGLLLLVLMLAATACMSTDNGAAIPVDDSPMAFRVGATTITVNQYKQRLEEQLGPAIQQLLAQGQTRDDIMGLAEQQNVWQSILDDMIQEELLLQYAGQHGIGVDPAEVDTAIEQQAAMGGASPAGTPTAEETTRQREEVARQQLIGKVVAQNTRADMFKSKHILVEDEATAQDIVQRLEAGEDFAQLARELSKDPGSADKGGEYGWIPRGDFVPEYEEAAFSAELNKPVIVQTQFGYHVIVVEDRAEDRAFDSVEQLGNSQSARTYYEQTFLPWYNQLRADTQASGDLEINAEFDPSSVELPFPAEMPAPAAPVETAPVGVTVVPITPEAPEVVPPVTATPVP